MLSIRIAKTTLSMRSILNRLWKTTVADLRTRETMEAQVGTDHLAASSVNKKLTPASIALILVIKTTSRLLGCQSQET